MTYSVVLLDGKELHNISAEQIRDLLFARKLNQESLFRTNENPQWQMLKRGFDLSKWIPANRIPQSTQFNASIPQVAVNSFQPFQQPPPQAVNQAPATADNGTSPVTFNRFSPVSQEVPKHQATNSYSQNNQSETYYQAESNQTNYNFQNRDANFQPSRYNIPTKTSTAVSNNDIKSRRNGARQAAIFIVVNAILYTLLMIIGRTTDADDSASGMPGFRGLALPLIVDAILAISLWTQDNVETARKWVLARGYLGLAVFGIVFPILGLQTGEALIAVFGFVTTSLYVLSIGITLHGKEEPSPSRLMIGAGTFAVYFLMMFGAIGLSLVAQFAPEIAALESKNREFDKYKIDGREFEDKTTGAKIALPEGWSMISLNNPVVHTPEARMIAVDQDGQSLTMLEVVPVPGNLDMKRQNSSYILDALADNVVKALKEESELKSGYREKSNFSEITRLGITVGRHPAKLLVFEKQADGQKMKGHMIITFDELTFYVMHSWCPAAVYDTKQTDFKHFEQNFVVPEKIKSTFTQSAEKEKNKQSEKKF